MIHCQKCQTVNSPDQEVCQNCGVSLLPGRGLGLRVGVLVVMLAFSALAVFVVIRITQGATMPDLGCALTSPIYWIIAGIAAPIIGLAYAFQRTPAYEKYNERARRHKKLDPEQALADFNYAFQIAPDKAKGDILKERAKLLEDLGQTQQATRDKIAAIDSAEAYGGAATFAAMIGADAEVVARDAMVRDQQELLQANAAVGLGWCAKCKAAVELDNQMRCKLHPKARISAIKLAVPEDVQLTLVAMQDSLTKQYKALRVRRMIVILIVIIAIAALCYLTNMNP